MTKQSDTYGFTTTEGQYYFPRVMAEAKPEANFLLVTHINSRTGSNSLVLLVRKSIINIGDSFPNLMLCRRTLKGWLDAALNSDDDWLIAVVSGPDKELDKQYNIVNEEIKRINNALTGRNVKVTVTAF